MAETAMGMTPNYPQGVTPEKIWAILQEVSQSQKETDRQMQETDRIVKETAEQMQETDRRMKETDKRMKETDRKIGELSNRFGELAEHLVAPSIREKFNALGFTFGEVSKDKEIVDAEGNSIAEVDILLENGDTVMVVEVKSKPNQKDVKEHISRMEILRRRADARNDSRKFQGAIAGAILSSEVRKHILKNGFYAIEQTGDTVKITVPEGFKPREW